MCQIVNSYSYLSTFCNITKSLTLRRRFPGREYRAVPNAMAQLPEPFESRVFDDGFVEAHGFGGLGFFGLGNFLKSLVA